MAPPPTIFLATPSIMTDSESQFYADQLCSRFHYPSTAISLASTVFREQFAAQGGWEGFLNYVIQGRDFCTRLPVFNLICCVQLNVGKATGQIVAGSLRWGKKVCLLQQGDTSFSLSKILSIHSVDETNWQTGWTLNPSPPLFTWETLHVIATSNRSAKSHTTPS